MNIGIIISIASFAINIGVLVWRLSALNSKVQVAEKRVEEISTHFREYRKEMRYEMDKLVEKFDTKLQKMTEKIEHKIDEMQQQITSLTNVMTRIETKLNG